MGVFGGTLAWLMSSVINSNAVFALFATVVAQYLVYETFHYCCHVHKNWSALNAPLQYHLKRAYGFTTIRAS
ncbi:MAG: fatty acid hydroxylase [Herminiimonas sp.]|nr:fatty acid hydroxylase [Herminiimonas sp.]